MSLGCEGPDAYLKDENGISVLETVRRANPKMIRFLLEWLRPDKWGKHRKVDVPHHCAVLVIGADKPKIIRQQASKLGSGRQGCG